MNDQLSRIKREILEVLEHPEAQDGLYFRNFFHLHEEDDRKAVIADEVEILDALRELIDAGKVVMDESGSEAIFQLPPSNNGSNGKGPH